MKCNHRSQMHHTIWQRDRLYLMWLPKNCDLMDLDLLKSSPPRTITCCIYPEKKGDELFTTKNINVMDMEGGECVGNNIQQSRSRGSASKTSFSLYHIRLYHLV
jgi:hypothetical protein